MRSPTPEQLASFVDEPAPRVVPPEFAALTRRRGARALNVFGAVFVAFFPWRARRKRMRLLREGEFTFARILGIERSNMVVNNERRHDVRLEIDVEGIPTEVTIPAYGADAATATERFGRGDPIGLLYDPAHPRRCMFTARLLGAAGP